MSSPDLLTRRLAVEIFDAVLRHNKGLEDEYSSCMERQEQSQPLENRDRTFVCVNPSLIPRFLNAGPASSA